MTRHVGAAALARFREGDLGRRRAARVGAHLTRCARCTDLSAELAGITMLLASTPSPAMPDHLAARIQDTLASEAARRLAPDPGTERARRDRPRRAAGSRPHLRLPLPVVLGTLAAAGAIVVIGGGYLALTQHATRGTSASIAAGPAAPTAGTDHRAANLPNAGLPAFGPELRYAGHGGQASFVPVATGMNFVPAALTGQVMAALSQIRSSQAAPSAGTAATATPAGASPAPGRFDGVPVTALEGCVSRIAAGGRVLLVDVAKYRGRPATIIVV